jgi:hypothetical protein
MIEWSKTEKEMATAGYESVVKLFNDDGSVPEKGLFLVIDELKRLGKVEREISLNEVADLSILRGARSLELRRGEDQVNVKQCDRGGS